LWSYANPRGEGTAELCDVLIVCDPVVIIISVKEIAFKTDGDPEVQVPRWYRRAILKQVDQLHGAERCLRTGRYRAVIKSDGTEGVLLPAPANRKLHRVVVAIGGPSELPLPFGNFGDGQFIHVFNDTTLETLLRTLDTVSDFTDYLEAKEKLFQLSGENVTSDNELDLLAWYLGNAKTLSPIELIMPQTNAWQRFETSPQFQAKLKADEDSYLWDFVIEMISADIEARTFEAGEESLPENEQIVRVMARESRLARRVLSKSMWQFFDKARADGGAVRMVKSGFSKVGYVFLARNGSVSKQRRAEELHVRSFMARAILPDVESIVGLATETPGTAPHMSWVVTYFNPQPWPAHDHMFAYCLSRISGMFVEVKRWMAQEPEFPSDGSSKPKFGA
jgi:hypothetical protein